MSAVVNQWARPATSASTNGLQLGLPNTSQSSTTLVSSTSWEAGYGDWTGIDLLGFALSNIMEGFSADSAALFIERPPRFEDWVSGWSRPWGARLLPSNA